MSNWPRVTVLGTGLMGAPMALNLMKSDIPVTVWNRTFAKAQALEKDGAYVAPSAAEAVREAEIVISMLADGPTTAALMADTQLQQALSPDALWIEMSSVKPDEARAQAALLKTLGIAHLDAPVSGGTKGAEQGTLAIMVGGDQAGFDRALPALISMGRPVLVGPSGAGQLAKLANQAIVAITISAVAEATLLLEKGGADPAAVRLALKGGFADSTILQQHGARMSGRDFLPGGLSKFQLKDLDNVLAEAASLDLTLPATQSVRDRFDHFVHALGGADLDHSGLFLELVDRNGGRI